MYTSLYSGFGRVTANRMRQQSENQHKGRDREFLGANAFEVSESAQPIASIRTQAADTLAQIYSALNPAEDVHPVWAYFSSDPNQLLAAAFRSAHANSPQEFIAPPLSFVSVEAGSHDLDFLQSIRDNPYRSLEEVYVDHPSPREACCMAAVLLQGKSAARIIAFTLLAKVCSDDSQPFSAEACLFSLIVFSLAQTIGTAEDRRFVRELQATLALTSSATWERLFLHSLEAFPKTPSGLADRRELVEMLLYFNDPRPFCWALTQALSKDCAPELSQAILSRLIERPLPGTPALTGLLSRIVQTCDSTQKSDYKRLLSNVAGFTRDYWGQLSPWTFERPLRILNEYNVDPLKLRLTVSPNIRLSTFLAACNVADCSIEGLRALDRGFQRRPDHSQESNDWLSEQLRQSLYRSAFLTPREHARVSAELPSFDLTQPDQLHDFCSSLSQAGVSQRRNFPHIAALRLILSRGPAAELPWCIAEALFSSSDPAPSSSAPKFIGPFDKAAEQVSEKRSNEALSPDEAHLLAVLAINPVEPPAMQLAQLLEQAPETSDWLGDDSFQSKALNLAPKVMHSLFSSARIKVNPVQEFVRSQTIDLPAPGLLDVLGEALAHYQPTDSKVFSAWRYDVTNPIVARQLRSLSKEGRDLWESELSARVDAKPAGTATLQELLASQTRYHLFLTHHPEVLMRTGSIPTFTAACTSYNNAAYYSKALISFLVDAHIKVLVALDTHKLLHEVAPRLPDEFTAALKSTGFSDQMFSKYSSEIMKAAEVRTVIKLVETPEGKPILLMQPSFIKGSFKKMHNSLESVAFMRGVADAIGTGLATRSYVNQESWPLRTFILPPSRSPGGQLENHDFALWLSGHHGATAISGSLLLPPP